MDTTLLILSLALGIVGGIGGGFAIKWMQAKRLLKDTGEALVAAGLCMIKGAEVLDDDKVSGDERKQVSQAFKNTGTKFSQAFATACRLFSRE